MKVIRILVADPLELVAVGIGCWFSDVPELQMVGHSSTGIGLLNMLRSTPADLVLLEVSLPGMDGIDTARALRKQHPEIKILAHSALTEIEYVNSMLIEGAWGYLVKGTTREEMLAAIIAVSEGRRHISEAAQHNLAKGYTYTEKRMDGEYIGLTVREREVIRLVALERTNEEIGALLHVSAETVKTHRKRIMGKLNVRSVAGLVKYAVDRRWV